MASFVKNYDNLFKRWRALQKGAAAAANRQAKLKPETTTTHGTHTGMEFSTMTLQEQFNMMKGLLIPAKYRFATMKDLKVDTKLSRLPAGIQEQVLAKMRANQLNGYAFFAPAGFSKTTFSYALYERAIAANLIACGTSSAG